MTGFDSTQPVKNEKGVWYKVYVSECVLCGGGDNERTRMPPPKPEDLQDCYEYEQFAHDGHFM